jgi:SAM-dependent methyltransferase
VIDAEELRARKDDVARAHGPWVADNIHLGHGVFTIAPDAAGAAEARAARVVQLVSDLARKPLDELRILDLGCLEGGFAVPLAQRGAHVTAVDGRESHVAKVRFAADALGLSKLEVLHDDARELDLPAGGFDVVLCLGLLYHLDAGDAVALARRIATWTSHLALVETQVGLTPRAHVDVDGLRLSGQWYAENTSEPAASLDTPRSFWPTRASLYNLLRHAGLTSVLECHVPRVDVISDYRDHVLLVAAKGDAIAGSSDWPERPRAMAHPSQGPRWRIADRIGRLRGHGLRGVFKGD